MFGDLKCGNNLNNCPAVSDCKVPGDIALKRTNSKFVTEQQAFVFRQWSWKMIHSFIRIYVMLRCLIT